MRYFSAEEQVIARRCLHHVGLLDRLWQRTDTLSGGKQQRVAIAKILAQKPQVILAEYACRYASRVLGLRNGLLVFDGSPTRLTEAALRDIFGDTPPQPAGHGPRFVGEEVGYLNPSLLFSPEDIAGKTFAFNDPNSTSGYLVPMTFFLMEMGIAPQAHFSKLTFSGSHEASILAIVNKKVDVASTNLLDVQQMTNEGKIPRGIVRVIWVSKLTPNDPIVVRKDLPDTLKQAIQRSLTTMKARNSEALAPGGAWIGGFVKVDDASYQIIRDLNETAKRLAALK